MYCILSSIMHIQVKCAHEIHNDFWNFIFYFLRIISQELIIASLFVIKAIFTPFSATYQSMYSVQGIFQHHFQCKKCALYSIKYGMCVCVSVCLCVCVCVCVCVCIYRDMNALNVVIVYVYSGRKKSKPKQVLPILEQIGSK